MPAEQIVHLERIGRLQTLRIPSAFELSSDEALIRKEGERLIIEPAHKPSLLAYLATLEPLAAEFPDVDADLLPIDEFNF